MYHLRCNPHSILCVRCIEIEAKSDNLCSQFNYIVCVPFESITNDRDEHEEQEEANIIKGIVYVWLGTKANHDESRLAEEIALKMYKTNYTI
jgi:hypothetical protein